MTNPFESGTRKAIPAVLIYVRRPDLKGDQILMIHRDGRPDDHHSGKWNGLGGKLEADESPVQAARRELKEESGLDFPESAFRPLGVLQFPNFKPRKNEDWIVWVFSVEAPLSATVLPRVSEGSLHWIPEGELMSLPLWAGDRHFLPLVLESQPFVGSIWYRHSEKGAEVERFSITEMV